MIRCDHPVREESPLKSGEKKRGGRDARWLPTSDLEHQLGFPHQQQILRLEIHVADIVIAQISQRRRELLQKPAARALGQLVLLPYEARQVPAVAVLHDDVYVPVRTYICIFFLFLGGEDDTPIASDFLSDRPRLI